MEPWLLNALLRGIGVHHSGMNRIYRQVVEMFFRRRYLTVCIATGTLSLGINMPCATVVFAGDSVFLTALNQRQSAGRAGRRGYDLLGNVVFHNVGLEKTCRLLSSSLPTLQGHFPLSTTLVLRAFALLNESKNSEHAVKTINSLLSQPRLYLDGQSFKEQVLHHLRFSIEYLRKQSLLSAKGEPINFTSFVSHLYYTENSAFAFHALLSRGYFHEVCADIDKSESKVLRKLMLVMAHLFGRRQCRKADREWVKELIKKSASIVFLPPMPREASRILKQHDKETLNTYTTYVRTFADQHIKEPERALPLTEVPVGGQGNTAEQVIPDFVKPLKSNKTRSSFVGLSGCGDSYKSISDLCSSVRDGIFLEEAVIPHLGDLDSPLNACKCDLSPKTTIKPS